MTAVVSNWADLHRQVMFGKSSSKIIWQPRIGAWLTDKQFAGEPFPSPYTVLDLYGIYHKLGCSARLYEYNSCFKREDCTHHLIELFAPGLVLGISDEISSTDDLDCIKVGEIVDKYNADCGS